MVVRRSQDGVQESTVSVPARLLVHRTHHAPELAERLADEGRARTLPMVRGDVALAGAQGSDYF